MAARGSKFLDSDLRINGQVNSSVEPKLSDMTGLIIRAANQKVGEVETSNDLLNKIHNIIDRAIQVSTLALVL